MADGQEHLSQVRCLVVYYSRTGRTRALAESVAHAAQADLELLRDARKRTGLFGWILSLWDALRRRPARIGPLMVDPGEYDLVFVGTPVWADSAAPAARAFLQQYADQCKHLAFFATHWGPQPGQTFSELAELADRLPAGTFSVAARQIESPPCADRAREFALRAARVAASGRQRV
jgi:flavodoxin